MTRETLGSRLGFILISAGCAIGLGNVWRFPWLAGQYGGAWFVLFYALFLVLLGLPVMTMEFAMGRAARTSPILMYRNVGHPGWTWHGVMSFVGCTLLMMYYTTVAGWLFSYFWKAACGSFAGLGGDFKAAEGAFAAFRADPAWQVVPMALAVAAGFGILSIGLRGGLERVTKWMMLGLLGLMAALAVHSVTLPGSGAGVKYFLVPNAANVAAHGGWGRLVVEAMNQAFFTLSLGIGSMAIFGSYIGRDRALAGESVRVTALDTVVAMAAGFIVIPACFALTGAPGNGPGLLFHTLPAVFGKMPGGRFWGALFFLFMSFAAFSTVLAVFENILACFRDLTGLGRRPAAAICAALLFVLSLPCALAGSALSGFHPLGPDSGVLDLEDFLVSNLMLPIGSLAYVVFCTRRVAVFRKYRPGWGWGWRAFREEANRGEGLKVPDSWPFRFYVGILLPLVIAALLVIGLLDKFHLLDKLR